MTDNMFHPEAQVVGIAIYELHKAEISAYDSDGKEIPAFFSMKYTKDTVRKPYNHDCVYELHCKIFNPGYDWIKLSAAMYAGDSIEIETHLSTIENLRNCLIYPKIMNEDERRSFHQKNLQGFDGAFPFQEDKKYFFYKKFEFDHRYPYFYETEDPISIIFRIGTGPQSNNITISHPEQRFLWNHKS